MLGRLWPRDDAERQEAIDAGYDLDEVLDRRPPRLGRRRLLRRDRRDRRRAPPGRALPALGAGFDRVAGHALALGHGAHGAGAPRPGQAARDHRRPVRLSRPRCDARRFGYVGGRGTREPQAGAAACRGRRDRLHRSQADARAARARRDGSGGRALAREGEGPGRGRRGGRRRRTCSTTRASRSRLRAFRSPTTSSTRWAAARSDDSFAERDKQGAENFGDGGQGGGRRPHRLPRRSLRRRLEAPREPPRERRDPPGVGRPRHLRAGRRGDRRRLGVVPHPLLPRQEAARDGHAQAGRGRRPSPSRSADARPVPGRHPGRSRRRTAARSRSAAPTSPPTAG